MKLEQPDAAAGSSKVSRLLLGALTFAALTSGGSALAADALQDGRIGYVMTERRWAVYESGADGKVECPHGFNSGPREQFEQLFPKNSTKTFTEMESRLMREGRAFHLENTKDPFPFYEAQGPKSYGLNLDGKIGPNDYQGPEGEKGIDNQLYRAIGCIAAYRMGGVISFFDTVDMYRNGYNRWLIELTGVDDMKNDDDVTVTTYRGLNDLYRDGTGQAFAPGSTQDVDARWGQSFVTRLKGKIVNGVLTTEPVDMLKWPNSQPGVFSGYYIMRGSRFQLQLNQEAAKGVLAGYVDVDSYIHQLNTNWATHHQSYGQLSAGSLNRALLRLADGYPDPKTGANTAISSAIELQFVQTYLMHPQKKTVVASKAP